MAYIRYIEILKLKNCELLIFSGTRHYVNRFFFLTGRGKKKGSKDHIWAAGAAAALGTSALFALTGKAAITSLMALLLSLLCYFRGHHGSHYTASGAILATPYRHQCAEAIIDVNGRNEHTTAILGYKKRTADDSWNYPRYASPLTDNT